MVRRKKYWLQRAIKRPGRVEEYIKRRYGTRAFYGPEKDKVKTEYIKRAIADLKERPPSKRPKGLLNALYLALRLKRMARKKKKRG